MRFAAPRLVPRRAERFEPPFLAEPRPLPERRDFFLADDFFVAMMALLIR